MTDASTPPLRWVQEHPRTRPQGRRYPHEDPTLPPPKASPAPTPVPVATHPATATYWDDWGACFWWSVFFALALIAIVLIIVFVPQNDPYYYYDDDTFFKHPVNHVCGVGDFSREVQRLRRLNKDLKDENRAYRELILTLAQQCGVEEQAAASLAALAIGPSDEDADWDEEEEAAAEEEAEARRRRGGRRRGGRASA